MLNLFKKPIVSQSDFTAGRAVSIWIGDFQDEDALDSYLDPEEGFAADFGFRLDERSLPEISVEQEPVDVRQLLNGFSLYQQFVEEAVRESEKKKIGKASAAVVFHFLSYPESAVRSQKRMRFLGRFSVEGFK